MSDPLTYWREQSPCNVAARAHLLLSIAEHYDEDDRFALASLRREQAMSLMHIAPQAYEEHAAHVRRLRSGSPA